MSKKIVLITGCTIGGIGAALVERFAEEGCIVYATARRLNAMDGFQHQNIRTLSLDVTKEDQVRSVVDEVYRREGQIDVLVNNAGRAAFGPVIDVPIEQVKETYEINYFGTLRLCQAVVPIMAKRSSGLIINVGSVGGEIPTPWHGIYSSSKAAVHNLTDTLALECRPLGINVMLLSPGSVTSNFSKNTEGVFSLPADSLFKAYLPGIMRRVYTSQKTRSMPAYAFANDVVGKALQKNPPTYFSSGGNSFIYYIMSWWPRSLALRFMWTQYNQTS